MQKLLFLDVFLTTDILFDDNGFEFSLIFLHWNKIKFHIIQAWTNKMPAKHINLVNDVLKFPVSKSILSMLEFFKPNL